MKFNFNELYKIYKNSNLNLAREMLYSNIQIFINSSDGDIIQDAILLIDARIQQSIEKGFNIKQTYSFVKIRCKGWLINRADRGEKGEDYVDEKDETINIGYDDFTPLEYANSNSIAFNITGGVLGLNEPYKSIILMTYYLRPPLSNWNISTTLGLKKDDIQLLHNEAIDMLRDTTKNISFST